MISGRSVVMIVDSLVDEREMYAEALVVAGFRVTPCDDPNRAFEQAIANPPDVVVTRIVHAVASSDSVEFARRLKKDTRTRRVPVVVLTSRVEPQLRTATAAVGCEAYLLLPCLPENLIAVINGVLSPASPA
jgi:CheY-like chemotaxis protein